MGRLTTVMALAWMVLAAGVCPAAGQGEEGGGMGSSRPFSGLFGGAEPLGNRGQMLSLTLSGFGGWDDTPKGLGSPDVTTDDRVALSGTYGGGSATLNYTRSGDAFAFGAFGTTFAGYFPDSGRWYDSQAVGASASTSLSVSRRGTLRLSQQASFATEYRLGYREGIAGFDAPLADGDSGFDSSLEQDPSISLASDVDYGYRISQRSTLSAFYGYRTRAFLRSRSDRVGFHDHVAGARLQRSLGRYASLRLGYAYRRPRLGGDEERGTEPRSYGFHDIDAGVDYSRSLSLTRKTTVSFSTGSTVAASATDRADPQQGPEGSGEDEPGLFDNPRIFLVGSATISRELGRSWSAQAAYTRGLSYAEGFRAPALRDSVTASIGGLITSRLDFTASGVYSTAAVGLTDRNATSWVASSQLRAGLTKNLAAYLTHYYFKYGFDEDLEIPGGLRRRLERQGIRFGLTTWLPLWSKR